METVVAPHKLYLKRRRVLVDDYGLSNCEDFQPEAAATLEQLTKESI